MRDRLNNSWYEHPVNQDWSHLLLGAKNRITSKGLVHVQSTGNNQWQNIVLPIITEYSFYWLDMDTEGFDREEEVACTWKVEINKAQFYSDFWLLVLIRGEVFFFFFPFFASAVPHRWVRRDRRGWGSNMSQTSGNFTPKRKRQRNGPVNVYGNRDCSSPSLSANSTQTEIGARAVGGSWIFKFWSQVQFSSLIYGI